MCETVLCLRLQCTQTHTADAVTYWCCWLTVPQSELTSQREQSWSWHACVDSGGVRLAHRCGWTIVERFPKLCRHWSCLCCTPGPQDTLHSDHELASQLTDREGRAKETITHSHMVHLQGLQFPCWYGTVSDNTLEVTYLIWKSAHFICFGLASECSLHRLTIKSVVASSLGMSQFEHGGNKSCCKQSAVIRAPFFSFAMFSRT